MQEIASGLWDFERRWTPGEIAWSVLTEPDGHSVEFADDGFVWVQDDVAVIVLPRGAGQDCALDRCAAHAVQATATDDELIDALRARGYHDDKTAPFDLTVRLAIDDASAPIVEGYDLRSARDDDDLVAVHRASWKPADLPFAPGHTPDFDGGSSSFSAAHLDAVRRSPLYNAKLHVVAEAADGALAGSCIGWLDDSSGVAVIEPLGVVVAHRRRGVAGGLCLEVARLVAECGASEVLIHPRGDDAYPAARGAYGRAGFQAVGRSAVFRPPG